ncbi:LuxR C-terminal-related transcriptional regulator [Arthrobacter sp. I2-34]|uniref:LuxR C-terminal-related transcriptional regulator n=1 Tax=Arthrobacter hankyongi TaxID=2904801 RepID=A0ABS9L8R3_9MICC|nr:GAF domain-containing protein [Arthrobacter hankyongi]MCG2623066.1 LuxR C-terminal-related transcriptional regulator [Arthrobacter hankyongi]
MDRLVTIRDAAAESGASAWRLRAWEAAGLLHPSRSSAGYRLYSDEDIQLASSLREAEDQGDRVRLRAAAPVTTGASGREQDFAALAYVSPSPGRGMDLGHGVGRPLRRLAHGISHREEESAVLHVALDSALEVAGATVGALSLADMATQRYGLVASRGLSEAYVKGITTWRLHEGLAGESFGLREPLAIPDLSVSPGVARAIVHQEGLRGYICLPLLRGQRRLGILEVFSKSPRDFGHEELAPLEVVASIAAALLETFVIKRDAQQLRSERYRVISDWTSQSTRVLQEERRTLAADIRGEAILAAREGRNNAAAHRLSALADRLESGGAAEVDVVPAIRNELLPRLAAGTAKEIELRVDGWPARIGVDLSTRIYQVVDALAGPAAGAAKSAVLVVLGERNGQLVLEVHDDRLAPDDINRLATVATEARLAVRGMEGKLERAIEAPWNCGVKAILPFVPADSRLAALTPRERAVLESMDLGQPNRELAAALGISTKTLQNHLTAIYRKLMVSNRGQAMRLLRGD